MGGHRGLRALCLTVLWTIGCGGGTPADPGDRGPGGDGSGGPQPEVVTVQRPPEPPQPFNVRHVVMVQLDGLTPSMLRDYLSRPASRGDGRVLSHLLGASPAAGAPVRFERARLPRQVLAPLPGALDTVSASLLTGLPPREHEVRADGQRITPTVNSIFDAVSRAGGDSICVGFPDCGTATEKLQGVSDAVRVSSLAKALGGRRRPPTLITLRLNGLARALEAGGVEAGVDALSSVDRLLYTLADAGPPGESTLWILASGASAIPLSEPKGVSAAKVLATLRSQAKQPGLSPDNLQATGGLIRMTDLPKGADRPVAQVLAALPSTAMVLMRGMEGVSVFDPDLKAPRPLTQVEAEGYPDLERRVLFFANPGDVIALADAEKGYVYLPPGRAPGRVRQGGATAAETDVAVVFAGLPLRRTPPGALDQMPLEAVAPTLLDVLEVGAIKLGPDVEALSQAARLRPRYATPTSTRWASCREAGDAARRVEVPCTSVMRHTRDPRAAAEALLLRTVADAKAGAEEAVVRQRLELVAWLDPHVRWPMNDGGLKPMWPKRPVRGRSPGGVLVLVGGLEAEVMAPALGALEALGKAEVVPVQRLPLFVPDGDDSFAALIGRVTGASAVVWAHEGKVKITAPTALFGRLEGPGWSSAPLGSDISSDQRLATVASHIHLTQGLVALENGYPARASRYLSSVQGLSPEVDRWRKTMLDFSMRAADPEAAPAEGGLEAGWVGAVQAIMRRVDGEGPELPTSGEWGAREAKLLEAARAAVGKEPALCAQPPLADRLTALSRGAEILEKLSLPGLAARARIRRAGLLAEKPEAAMAELDFALTLIEAEWAGWLRADVARRVLQMAIYAPWAQGTPQRGALIDRAAQVVLRRMQADLAAARAEGVDPKKSLEQLTALLDGSTASLPMLQRETLELAVQGNPELRPALIQQFLVDGAGLTSLFTAEGVRRLRITADLIEQLADPPRGLKIKMPPEERALGLAVSALMSATADVLQGQMPEALARIEGANLLAEKYDALKGREAALKAGHETRMAAWGPQVLLVARLARIVILKMAGRAGEARDIIEVMLRDARAFARAETRRAAADATLDGHIDGVVGLTYWMLEVLLAGDDASRNEALGQMRKAARRVDMRLPKAGPRETARWWVLAGILARDIAWAVEVGVAGKVDRGQLKAWKGIKAGMEALVRDWEPALESRILRMVLAMGLTAQRALPEIVAGEGPWWQRPLGIDALKRLSAKLGQISSTGPQMAIDRLLAEQLQGVLANAKALGDEGAFSAAWGKVVNRQRKAMSPSDPAEARVLLLLESAAVATQSKRWSDVLALAKAGPALAEGTALSDMPFLWPALQVMAHRRKGDVTQAIAALDVVGDQCPALRWQLEPLRAISAANASAFGQAMERHRDGARQAQAGGIVGKVELTLKEGDGRLEISVEIPLMSVLLGRPTGTLQLGAGYQSESNAHEPVVVTVSGQASAVEAELQGLMLKAWRAFLWGDEAGGQEALRRLSVRFAAEGWQIREPLEAIWLGAIAELHGHRALGRWLIEGAAAKAEAGSPDSRTGRVPLCDDQPAPEGSELIVASTCEAPALLAATLSENAQRAVARWVALRMRAREGQPINGEAISEILGAANTHAASLVPEWSLPLTGAFAGAVDASELPELQGALVMAVKGEGNAVETAVTGGYACELTLQMLEQEAPRASLATVARACGASPFSIAALSRALTESKQLSVAWPLAAEALEMLFEVRGPGPAPRLWPLARRLASVEHPSWEGERGEAAARFARIGQRLEDPQQAMHFRAVALAVSLKEGSRLPEPSDEVLVDAMKMKPAPPSLPFLKALVFAAPDEGTRRQLAVQWLSGLSSQKRP
ncbi:MAG: hypothetical protein ACE366_30845 [Bradymonadia bacterium]